MKTRARIFWLIPLATLLFFGAAFITLRAAEQATNRPTELKHPPPSTPEESATIADDPTIAPDPSQSADNDVSFPTDI